MEMALYLEAVLQFSTKSFLFSLIIIFLKNALVAILWIIPFISSSSIANLNFTLLLYF